HTVIIGIRIKVIRNRIAVGIKCLNEIGDAVWNLLTVIQLAGLIRDRHLRRTIIVDTIGLNLD
ncbi:hypothetical protein HMPREF0294_2166, partial [Corynebacterium glucuronolyticum ATCC 51867]